ncbi:Solute carrier family 13 member [Trichinella spiralis]|uniref:Solute carrier family 13 member n=1 Tax=Trichinella spiralis TaxID=6334 RepID=A0ABR3KZP4_TRISP
MTKLEKDLRWSRFSQPNQGTEKQEDAARLPCQDGHASAGDNVQRKHANNLHLRQGVEICLCNTRTCGGGTKVLISHLNQAHNSGKMPQGFRVKMDMPQLVTMFNVNMRTIFTFDRVSKCNFDPS